MWNIRLYDLNIGIFPEKEEIKVKSKIHVNVKDRDRIILALNESLNVSDLFVDGRKVSFKIEKGKLAEYFPFNYTIISIDEELTAGTHVIDMAYSGVFQGYRKYSKAFWGGVSEIGAFMRCDEIWYPVKAEDPMSDYRKPQAKAKIKVKVPKEYRVFANGRYEGKKELENKDEYTYIIDYPAPLTLVAAKYVIKSDNEFKLAVFPKHENEIIQKFLKIIGISLNKLKELYEKLPFSPITIAELPKGYHGYSAPYLILFDEDFLTYSTLEEVDAVYKLSHELSHLWWGWYLRASPFTPGGIWLNESIADYSSILAVEKIYGYNRAVKYLEEARSLYLNPWSKHPDYPRDYVPLKEPPISTITIENAGYSWEPVRHGKGPWIYHMLRYILGLETLIDVLRELIRRKGGREITLDDFLNVLYEKTNINIDWFIEEWIRGNALPIYSVNVLAILKENGKYNLDILIQNKGTGAMPLDIQVICKEGVVNKRVWIGSKDRVETRIVCPSKPKKIMLDPNNYILKSYRSKLTGSI